MVTVTEILLYISFSLLMGGLILYAIPENKRPTVQYPRHLLLTCVLLIPVLSFAPLVKTAFILGDTVGVWNSLQSIIVSFKIGQAWIYTCIVTAFLSFLIYTVDIDQNRYLAKVAIFMTFLLVLGQGYAGHASSITTWSGFAAHSAHFLAVIIWVGVLLIIGWFSKDRVNWQAFLKWFTPLAIICVIVIGVAGYFTMNIDIQNYDDQNASIVSEYVNSWFINYGQGLVIKHLLIIPLLLFAFLNGFILRSRPERDISFNPLKWVKVEGIYALFVFSATAYMGQRYPPHEVNSIIQTWGASPLFSTIYGGNVTVPIKPIIDFGITSWMLFAIALVFLGLMVLSVLRRASAATAILVGLLAVLSAYVGLMLGVE